MSENIDVEKLKNYLEVFYKERDWEQFHNPKNYSMALSVEASELVELFQWSTAESSMKVDKVRVGEELADILIYAVAMAKSLDINLESALEDKKTKNEQKYPIDLSKGNAKKYSEFNK